MKRFHLPTWLHVIVIGRRPRRTLIRVVVLVAIILLVRQFVLLPIRVIGSSMMPTYPTGGVNLVNRLAYIRSSPQRGDVVAIRTSGTSIMFMKRIVGLPGETVRFHAGRLFINDALLVEPYLKYGCDWESEPKVLGPDRYYVVGDNRSMPEQDHTEGVAVRERIVGKILLCKSLFVSSP
jgi:signal peptidase I